MAERRGPLVVAIDGPAGVGKSTVAMAVASELGLAYVETGALYRAVALLALRQGVPLDNAQALARIAREMDLTFRLEEGVNRVFLGGKDVTLELRSPEVDSLASRVSALCEVRAALLDVQRSFATKGRGVVAEGRDIGTVVFPTADFKFFLVADLSERVDRRLKQYAVSGLSADREAVSREMEERDRQDSSRSVAPLKVASEAEVIDTTSLSVSEVVAKIISRVRSELDG